MVMSPRVSHKSRLEFCGFLNDTRLFVFPLPLNAHFVTISRGTSIAAAAAAAGMDFNGNQNTQKLESSRAEQGEKWCLIFLRKSVAFHVACGLAWRTWRATLNYGDNLTECFRLSISNERLHALEDTTLGGN